MGLTLVGLLLAVCAMPSEKMGARTGFITANGVKLHYLEWAGPGEAIVFIA